VPPERALSLCRREAPGPPSGVDHETSKAAGRAGQGDAPQGWPYLPSTAEMKELAKHAAEIRKLCRRGTADTIEIGRRLTAAKEILVHGSFLPWLKEEFAWSESAAQNFMRVYALAEKYKNVNFADLDVPVSGLYLLAAPKVSESAVKEVISYAERGAKLSLEAVKDCIDNCRPPSGVRSNTSSAPETEPTAPVPTAPVPVKAPSAKAIYAEYRNRYPSCPQPVPAEAVTPTAPAIVPAPTAPVISDELREIAADEVIQDDDVYDQELNFEERWNNSISHFASDAIAMRHLWKRLFGDWRQFKLRPVCRSLIKEAAKEWAQLARDLDVDVSAAACAAESPPPGPAARDEPTIPELPEEGEPKTPAKAKPRKRRTKAEIAAAKARDLAIARDFADGMIGEPCIMSMQQREISELIEADPTMSDQQIAEQVGVSVRRVHFDRTGHDIGRGKIDADDDLPPIRFPEPQQDEGAEPDLAVVEPAPEECCSDSIIEKTATVKEGRMSDPVRRSDWHKQDGATPAGVIRGS
jgi:hypothetical protein